MAKLFVATLLKKVDSKLIELDTKPEAEEFANQMFANWGYDMNEHVLILTETEHLYP